MLAIITQIWTLCMAALYPTHIEKYHTFRKFWIFLHNFYCPPKGIVPFLSETRLKLGERVPHAAVFEMLNYP